MRKTGVYKWNLMLVFLLLFLVLAAVLPQKAAAAEQSVTLSENGMELVVELPPGVDSIDAVSPEFVIVTMGDLHITLEIEDKTVNEKEKFIQRVHTSMMESYPQTTTELEELPDLVVGENTFLVRSYGYEGPSGEQITTMEAFCELNYRYIYTIGLRGEEAGYDSLYDFAVVTKTKTAFQPNPVMLALAVASFAVGVWMIAHEFWQKNFRQKTVGIVEGVESHWRSMSIKVSYRMHNGGLALGEYTTLGIAAMRYMNRIGKEVEISYSEQKPTSINVLAVKMGYIAGAVFIALALFAAYVMIFEM